MFCRRKLLECAVLFDVFYDVIVFYNCIFQMIIFHFGIQQVCLLFGHGQRMRQQVFSRFRPLEVHIGFQFVNQFL